MRARLAMGGAAALALLAAAPCRAADAAAGPPLSQEDRALAVRLYREASAHYELGEYEQAIPLFRRAYDLTRAPALIFNVAQTYRRVGDCRHALESYRQFLRASSDED